MDWARSKFSSMKSAGFKAVKWSSSSTKEGAVSAPHPIPPGKENMPCPINGMFLSKEAEEAKNELENDPDIVKEKQHFSEQALVMAPMAPPTSFIPMQVIHGAHTPSEATRRLVEKVGMEKLRRFTGLFYERCFVDPHLDQFIAEHSEPHAERFANWIAVIHGAHTPSEATRRLVEKVGMEKLRRFTGLFYERCFVDPHLDQFIAEHSEPHAERFANWIAEKLGFGTPWTQERRTRPKKFMHFGDETMQVSHDRSTAHFAAWYSPKREAQHMGQKFQPEDARNWMRLHFWAARETGLYDEHPEFMDYYERFIGHFVSIYSSKSPPFTRESARWSADPENLQRYHQAGNRMDILRKNIDQELLLLPAEERSYTGSRHDNPLWPYNREALR